MFPQENDIRSLRIFVKFHSAISRCHRYRVDKFLRWMPKDFIHNDKMRNKFSLSEALMDFQRRKIKNFLLLKIILKPCKNF